MGNSSPDWTGKTFFLTIWDKNLENMGIKPTWENMDELTKNCEQAFREISPYFYASLCESKDGRKHGHIAVSFEKAKKLKAVAKLFGNAHSEPMRGSKAEAIDYINKVGKYEEKGEIIFRKFGNAEKVKDRSGKRSDIDAIKSEIECGNITAENIDEYIYANAENETHARLIESTFMRHIKAKGGKEREEVEVIYVEGESGSGKTRGAYQRYPKAFKVNMDNKCAFPFDGYKGQETIILDELRPGFFKPAYLFQVLDRYPLNVNVKGSRCPALWTRVIITTSFPLDKWFTSAEDNEGQDNNRKQFKRRITTHLLAVKGEGEWIEWQAPKEYRALTDEDECPFT